MRQKIGIGLVLLGIMTIAFYFVYQKGLEVKNNNEVENYIENTKIQEEVEVPTEEPKEEINKKNYEINYTAVLEIPSINLKRGVVDNTKGFRSINYAISVDRSSNYPNEMGNFILYAHSGSSTIGYFNKLTNVSLNDDIYVYYNGTKYHYTIYDKYDIEKTGKAKVITAKDKKYITLITCNQKRKGYQIVIIGKLVEESSY